MEQQVKTREWVKTAAIIFLSVLLVLTFFSNTILNASLIQVSGQYAASGQIKARISGEGQITPEEVYEVKVSQARKVASVKVKAGKTVEVGDVLFVLDEQESQDLETARKELSGAQYDYDTLLVKQSADAAQNNWNVQQAQNAYDDALMLFQEQAGMDQNALDLEIQTLKDEKARLGADTDFYTAQENAVQTEKQSWESARSNAQTAAGNAQTAFDNATKTLQEKGYPVPSESAGALEKKISDATTAMQSFEAQHSDLLVEYRVGGAFLAKNADGSFDAMAKLSQEADNLNYLVEADEKDGQAVKLAATQYSFGTPAAYIIAAFNNLKIGDNGNYSAEEYTAAKCKSQLSYVNAENSLRDCEAEVQRCASAAASCQSQLDQIAMILSDLKASASKKDAEIEKLTTASKSAETVKTAKQKLEQAIFDANKGNTNALDLQQKKDALERAQEKVDKLIAESDEVEVTAKVAGYVSSVNITAGDTADPANALVTITLVDRGYTAQIRVTAEQAKRVTIGDTAETSIWGSNITATLESIIPDKDSKDGGKLLVFRLTGDVTPGQNITLTIGQRSQNFGCVIPKSALRNDANGDFVLVLKSKKAPLGTRYIAERVSVTKQAEDDSNVAVSGLENNTYIIVNAVGEVQPGTEVRLMESEG